MRDRCDGCGGGFDPDTLTYHDAPDGTHIATYCRWCDTYREAIGKRPGDHPQYRLPEETND